MIRTKKQNKQKLEESINKIFEEYYFDVQGINTGFGTLDEAYLARILTRIAVGSATVWWSILEVKEFIILRRKSKFLNGR